ncbi:MAG TPA: phosphate ABC transporter substrate-binding protein [Sedimentisphaerales bacterium]|nr:phosphate ABC transporter substrate-binding protein [Sedimentisphaerales bacterium]
MSRLVTFMFVVAVLAASPAAAAEKMLQISGSTTVGPLVDAFAEVFLNRYPGLRISVKKTGSGDGVAALVDGRTDIAMTSRFLRPAEFQKAVENGVMPVAHIIAMDGVCIAVHPSNPVTNLTLEQIKDIYQGKITNWKEVGGVDMPIVMISRDTSSGTFEVFHEIVMKKEDLARNVEYVNANPQAHARISTTPGAIGYVGLGFIDDKVKALRVNGVMPDKRTIAAGAYPIARPLYLFTNGYPTPGSMAHRFCTFYLTPEGQDIIIAKGFIPLTQY